MKSNCWNLQYNLLAKFEDKIDTWRIVDLVHQFTSLPCTNSSQSYITTTDLENNYNSTLKPFPKNKST